MGDAGVLDDMIVKSSQEELHAQHLKRVFKMVRKYNMILNPVKCTFGVRNNKLLGFYLTEQRIQANPNKCNALIQKNATTSK